MGGNVKGVGGGDLFQVDQAGLVFLEVGGVEVGDEELPVAMSVKGTVSSRMPT